MPCGDHEVDLGVGVDEVTGLRVLGDDPSLGDLPARCRGHLAHLEVAVGDGALGLGTGEPGDGGDGLLLGRGLEELGPEDQGGCDQGQQEEHQQDDRSSAPASGLLVVELSRVAQLGGVGRGHQPGRGHGRHGRRLHRLPGEVAVDVGLHRGGAGVAVPDVLGERLHHDRVELGGQVLVQARRRRCLLAHVLVGHRDRAVADEGWPAGEQLVELAPGGVDVGAGVDRLTAGLLGGEVLRRPHDRCGLGHRVRRVGDGAGDAEVHHLHVAGRGEHHVAGLDVAVDDPGAVAVVEGREYAGGDLESTLGQDLATFADDVAQGAPGDVLHHDVGLGDVAAVGRHLLAGVVDRHDRRVVEGGRRLGLTPEPRLEGGVAGEVGAQALDRDGAAEPHVGALANLGHAAASEELAHLVATADPVRFRHRWLLSLLRTGLLARVGLLAAALAAWTPAAGLAGAPSVSSSVGPSSPWSPSLGPPVSGFSVFSGLGSLVFSGFGSLVFSSLPDPLLSGSSVSGAGGSSQTWRVMTSPLSTVPVGLRSETVPASSSPGFSSVSTFVSRPLSASSFRTLRTGSPT